ncbi:MAG: hypothetical protein A3H42_00195 [Deltaproteobacteria bacterium RIFCSPLOWO2_02_FULL_46_8]|nr:MAG: hypothetical protein A3H42_00195 [Deltaproteobacteria bacterium RIFCSPLOWO2_02_FULL_46_8]
MERPPLPQSEIIGDEEKPKRDDLLDKLRSVFESFARIARSKRESAIIEKNLELLDQQVERGSDVSVPAEPPEPQKPGKEEPPAGGRRKTMSVAKALMLGAAGAAALTASKAKIDEMERVSAAIYAERMAELEKDDATKIRERISFDLAALAKKHGFEAQLRVDNGRGKYVVHIGQTHTSPLARFKGDFLLDVLSNEVEGQSQTMQKSQRDIFQLLEDIRCRVQESAPLEVVFAEGVGIENQADYNKELQDTRKFITDLQTLPIESPQTLKKLIQCFRYPDRLIGKAKQRESVRTASFAQYIRMQIDAKARHVLAHYKNHPSTSDDVNTDILLLETDTALGDADSFSSGADNLVLEAVEQFVIEGKVSRIAAAETKETNAKTMTQLKTLQKLVKRTQNAAAMGDREEVNHLREQSRHAVAVFRQLAMEQREDVAVRNILAEIPKIKSAIIPLVYGASHGFSNDVRRLALGKLGLIDCIPLSVSHKRQEELFKNRQKGRTVPGAHEKHPLQKNQPRGKGR